jgi:hypothetical protein
MTDFPTALVGEWDASNVIGPWSSQSMGDYVRLADTAPNSVAWPTANRALYVPFTISEPGYTATQMFVYNGTAVSGNIDVGIYDVTLARLVSMGSTAQAGTSAIQTFNITDTALPPGRYWMGVAMDNTTGTLFRWGDQFPSVAAGMFTQASAWSSGMPSTATVASMGGLGAGYVPCIAMTSGSVV